ncbi:general alpha-glucoside permease [Purpureocillium lavendulum]|uniref:L-arabinitol 4-dehydrogenase n=1 Tax=Purpureocillium lavendulum TaxID=1247861 RepID=A0AB34FQA5_9HYPO|nr:general alpha-glucoside permease [Purpureocillium lavendulum]
MQFASDPPTDGMLCRYFKTQEDFLYRIPDHMSLQEGVLLEPLSVAVHSVRLSGLRPGQSVLIQGSGTIGLLTAATAAAFGASNIFISDINESRLEFAKTFVQCTTFQPIAEATPADEAARFRTDVNIKDGVDVVLECTGVESSTQSGLHIIAAGGTFVQVGMGKPYQSLPLMVMSEKEITFKSAFRYGAGDYQTALELLKSRRVSVKPLIGATVPFEKAEEAWAMTQRGEGIKNLIKGLDD